MLVRLNGVLSGVFFSGIVFCSCSLLPAQAAATAVSSAEPSKSLVEKARVDAVLKQMRPGHSIGQVALSLDGRQMAWVESAKDGTEIWMAPPDDPEKKVRITVAAKNEEVCQEHDLLWAPDSRALAFFSDCGGHSEQSNLYLQRLSARGAKEGAAQRLTDLHGYTDSPAFSPDGQSIAFLYVEGASRPAGALAAIKPWAGVIGEDGMEIQRIALARADAKTPLSPHWFSPAGLHVFEFDWAPDSESMLYTAANPPGENNWWVAKLYTQKSEDAPRAILAPAEVSGEIHGLQIAVPRWSPDGKQIAFIGGLMSDQGSTGGDIWAIPAEGGEPVNLTPKRPATPTWIEWGGNHELFFSELSGGNARLEVLRTQSGEGCAAGVHGPFFSLPATIGDGRMEMSLSSDAAHTLFAFKTSSFEHPEEIWQLRTGNASHGCSADEAGTLTQLSHWNDAEKPVWGKAESLSWNNEGYAVQGWLMQPKDYDSAQKYPLIVLVHGGPAAAATPRWGGAGLNAAVFSALGYFVLQPNPRGSFGQGEAFTQANRRDFGYGDLRDILAGVDAALTKYPIDSNRVGITGWSYGGFMTMFSVTQTSRFRAAVAGAGISNWLSYYGENSIGEWMLPYFGASAWDDPAVYARSSAINQIKKAVTPTLVVVGDRDGECPAPQSFEFWRALKAQGVPTRLVVYPNEGHGFRDAEDRRDMLERAMAWLDRWLQPEADQKP